jgi:hypothetical protein
MTNIGYIKAIGIYYKTELRTIHKKNEAPLQAIFEAFTNSLESIQAARELNTTEKKGYISIELHVVKNLLSSEDNTYNFDKITITDSGIGFNDKEYTRFLNLRDDRKNFKNKGTGRVQYLHTFDKTIFNSIYQDANSSTGFSERKITLSKAEAFLKQNAIIRLDAENETTNTENETTVTFHTVLEDKDKKVFNYITAQDIKRELIRHYLAGFCEHREELPEIKITKFIEGAVETELNIKSEDIPIPTKEEPIEIRYSKVNGNVIEKTSNKEIFDLKAFVIPKNELDKNGLKLISKGEEAKEITLRNLIASDEIDGNRYLFLLSGNYIDERDSDTRGEINIVSAKDLKSRDSNSLFTEEEILIEDIEDRTNQTIVSLFKEIQEKRNEKEENIKELQKMFLLNDKTLNALKNKIKIDDSDDVILRKVYEADAKIIAQKDAEIKQQIKVLEDLDTTKEDYQETLSVKVDEFVKTIPLQNRTALTQYVARRKMVIELFGKILKKEIEKLKDGGRIDENLMHNLIFQQSTDNPEVSDLWLIAEDFIYFKGVSEFHLNKLEIEGEKIFNKKFTEEEERYLNSLGEKRLTKRPDVLLFPSEGKCIIIEFKAPDVNVSEHLSQIDFYANLIRNYTNDKFQITTFYGYLIGESIEDRDVRGHVSRFEHSYHLDYWFRPSENVNGFDNRSNGSIYTEVIKYSTLLERAELRNKIFIQKLENTK